MNDLIKNIDRLHTTKMGIVRIKRNLSIVTDDVVQWCRAKILNEGAIMKRRGKNWYIRMDDCELTVHACSYTVITAHRRANPPRRRKAE